MTTQLRINDQITLWGYFPQNPFFHPQREPSLYSTSLPSSLNSLPMDWGHRPGSAQMPHPSREHLLAPGRVPGIFSCEVTGQPWTMCLSLCPKYKKEGPALGLGKKDEPCMTWGGRPQLSPSREVNKAGPNPSPEDQSTEGVLSTQPGNHSWAHQTKPEVLWPQFSKQQLPSPHLSWSLQFLLLSLPISPQISQDSRILRDEKSTLRRLGFTVAQLLGVACPWDSF